VRGGGDVDDTSILTNDESFKQQVCKQKVRQVIDGKDRLDAVNGGRTLAVEDTRVVDQDMDLRVTSQKLSGETTNFGLGGEICQQYIKSLVTGRCANSGARRFRALGIPAH
jgi:hypothetical protein